MCLVDYGHTVWSLGGVVCGGWFAGGVVWIMMFLMGWWLLMLLVIWYFVLGGGVVLVGVLCAGLMVFCWGWCSLGWPRVLIS